MLTQGKEALVDDDDYEMLMEHKWSINFNKNNGKHYAKRNCQTKGARKIIRMHREIMNAPKRKQVDHINGNTLDNRKENLRLCTNQQNQWNSKRNKNNTSGYKGVSYRKKHKVYRATINYNDKQIYLGTYKTKEQAALAYNKKAIELYGEYAYLNNVL